AKVDKLISIRSPSYALKHPDHVCWLNHRMREYYDLWPEWTSRLGLLGKAKETVRKALIHAADERLLKHNVRKVFAQSQNIQQGLIRWGNIPSEVLYPPAPPRNYRNDGYGDFIFSPARLTPLKRIPLLIEALARVPKSKAVLSGDGAERNNVEALIKNHNLQDRITLAGHLEESEVADYYARCRAVYYAPRNEDFGLVTVEAFQSQKPVITAVDSGGPTELVKDGISGLVVQPETESIAAAITRIYDEASFCEKAGRAGFDSARELSWPNTVARLLA